MNLTDRTAIVTGTSSGLGRAIATALTQKGTRVYGLARRQSKLEQLQQKLGELFIPVPMDVTDQPAVASWIEETFSGQPLPDILINNAGLAEIAEVDQLTPEQWHRMIDTNLNAIFYLTRSVVPLMKQNQEICHILNISSIAGLLGNPELSGYNASKFAVRGFSEALFKELRYEGIKVSCLFPGSIATDFFDLSGMGTAHPNMMMPEDVASTVLHLLETPDNLLINEVTMRPLNPKPPEDA
ncbi:MAG: SDR family oxidoreductase [Balneolaceae bacterium]